MRTIALLAALTLAPLAASAQPAAAPPERPEVAKFRESQKTEREAFLKKHLEERRAFEQSLKDKAPEERKKLRQEFRAKQKEERRAFHRQAQERRSAFRQQAREERRAKKRQKRQAADKPAEPKP